MAVHSDPVQRERLAHRAVAGGAAIASAIADPQPAHPLQQALNDSPRMAPQRHLQRMLAESPRVAEQNGLAARLAQRRPVAGETTQRVADPTVNVAAAVRRPVSHRAGLRAALMQTTSLTPVQRAGWDWLPGVGTIASVLGSGYVGAKAGTALGSYAGPNGALVGGVLGGLAGLAGGIYGAVRGGVTGAGTLAGAGGGALAGSAYGPVGTVLGGVAGGVTGLLGGAAIQDVAPAKPRKRLAAETIPSLGTVTYRRAVERAMAEGREDEAALNRAPDLLDDPELRTYLSSKGVSDWVKQQSSARQRDWPLLMVELIDRYYADVTKTAAKPGDAKGETIYAKTLSGVLAQDPLIKAILDGELERMKPAADGGALDMPAKVPAEVAQAGSLFNNLVSRKVSPLPGAKRILSPISGINREGGVQLGSVSPVGAALHELGHHLEYNLAPSEFATLHNFLRARSASETRRHVGYEGVLGGQQSETGYDIDLPDLGIAPSSLTDLIGSGVGYKTGQGRARAKAAAGIDRFIVGHGNRQEISYASQISEISYDTEFLSTTIHFFGDPELALKLVRGDPLRVCLFLSFANPEAYERVRKAFAHDARDAPDLNRLIHKVTPDKI